MKTALELAVDGLVARAYEHGHSLIAGELADYLRQVASAATLTGLNGEDQELFVKSEAKHWLKARNFPAERTELICG